MKNGTTLGLIALLVWIATSTAYSQTQFELVRDELRHRFTKIDTDGQVVPTKQFERWQWFWEPRLMPDGSFPTPQMYAREAQRVNNRKVQDDAQAIPAWKEIGPIAPDLPGRNNVWSGIGRVNTIAASHSNASLLWAGTAQGGIWKSTNGGSTWTPISVDGLPTFGVSDITIAKSNANVIYVATGDVNASTPGELSSFPGFSYGLIKSTDNGVTWKRTSLTYEPAQNNLISRVWVDPRNENIVIAATYSGIVKSTDGGETWSAVSVSLAFRDLIGNPQTYDVLYASTFSFSGSATIYRSTNAGDSWETVMSIAQANRVRLAVTPDDPSLVGAVASRASTNGLEGVYRSTDYGKTFVKLNVPQNLLGWSSSGNDHSRGGQGFYDLAMAISPSNAKTWTIGGVNTWKSTNKGDTWSLSAHWTGSGAPWVHADHHYHYYHPLTDRLYICNDGGVAYSDDYGITWRDMSKGMAIQQYYGLAVSNQDPDFSIAGAQDNGTAITYDGKAFAHVLAGDGMATAVDKFSPNVIYSSQPYGSFFRSDNQGSQWRQIATAGTVGEQRGAWVSPIVTDTKNTLTVYIGYTQLYKSTNGGTNWTKLTDLSQGAYLRKIAIAPSDNRYIYIGYNTTMFYSTNGGQTWTEQSGVNGFIQDIKVHPDDPKRVFVAFGGFSGSLKLTEFNNGTIINRTGSGLPNVPANAVAYQKGVLNRLYLGTDVGVFFQDEGTDVWEPYGHNVPTTVVSGMELLTTTNKLRISTYGRGLWEVDAIQCLARTPNVRVEGPSTVCQGDTITLVADAGYDRYIWSNGQTGQQLKVVNFTQTGSYTVSVVDGNGCRATSAPTSIIINRAPARPNISLRGADTLRSSAIGGITKFQWYLNGVAIPGATDREYVALIGGIYTVMAISDEGCSTLSSEYELDLHPNSVDADDEIHGLTFHPNPTEDMVSVHLPEGANGELQVIDMTGAVVHSVAIPQGASALNVNVSALAAGVYLVRVETTRSLWTASVVKR
jgi:photosystem II stability/assembly factor-like uncharacterized protein